MRDIQRLRGLIDAGKIVRRLQAFSNAEEELVRDAETGEAKPRLVVMDANQVRAANILLNKCMPDLQSTQVEITNNYQDVSTAELYARLREVMHMAEEKAGVIEDVEPRQLGGVDDLLEC